MPLCVRRDLRFQERLAVDVERLFKHRLDHLREELCPLDLVVLVHLLLDLREVFERELHLADVARHAPVHQDVAVFARGPALLQIRKFVLDADDVQTSADVGQEGGEGVGVIKNNSRPRDIKQARRGGLTSAATDAASSKMAGFCMMLEAERMEKMPSQQQEFD